MQGSGARELVCSEAKLGVLPDLVLQSTDLCLEAGNYCPGVYNFVDGHLQDSLITS